MLLAARSAMKQFPPTTLIRLYELLKNSRSIPTDAGVNNKAAWRHPRKSTQAALVLNDAIRVVWWRMTGSNRRPPACKAGALPAELIPRNGHIKEMVGLVGLEPTTPALSRRCSNQLSYRPGVVATVRAIRRWRHLPTTDKCERLSLTASFPERR